MHSQHITETITMEFLWPSKNTCTPLFQGLPKTHKPNCPLRPIVSECDDPTDHLSSYIIHFIQPLANNLPSYIIDTKHFLNLIEKHLSFPTNAFLVTVDVTSLYTNIPHDDGIAAIIQSTEEYKHLLPTNCPPPRVQSSISSLNIALSISWTYTSTNFLTLPRGQGWLLPVPIFSWVKKNGPSSWYSFT